MAGPAWESHVIGVAVTASMDALPVAALALMPHAFQDADDMRRFDLVEPHLAQRLAGYLDNALELGSAGLVFQAGLVCCALLVGELAKQARTLGPALFVALVDALGDQAQMIDGLVHGFGGLEPLVRLSRTEAHFLHDPGALVAESPAAATGRRDDQIEVVAAGVFARPNGEVIFQGDVWLCDRSSRGSGVRISKGDSAGRISARNGAYGRWGASNSNRG